MRWLKQWWPAVLWAVAISVFSTGVFTEENTSRIIVPVLHWLFPNASHATLVFLHHVIRKCAHFTEYFILSLLILRGIRAGRRETHLAWALAAIGAVAGYAAIDEFHQRFVAGRTPAVRDVLIDTSGGIAAQLIAGLSALWVHTRERREEDDDA